MTREQIKVKEDNWKYRRLMAFGSSGTLLAMIGYLAAYADSTNIVQQTLAGSLPLGLVGIVMAYIGGPIADDWLQLKLQRS